MLALTKLTFFQTIRHNVTLLSVFVALIAMAISFIFGVFNFSDADRLKLLFTSGVAVNILFGTFLSILLTNLTIYDELSNKTAHAIFAKPTTRSAFLYEKVLAIFFTVFFVSVFLCAMHVLLIYYAKNYGFDAHPLTAMMKHKQGALAEDIWVPYKRIILTHFLSWFHTAPIIAVTAICAIRLPLWACYIIPFTVFVLSHALTTEIELFILPSLSLFNMDTVLQIESYTISLRYFFVCFAYAILYSLGILSIGDAFFSKQDIA